MCVQSVLDAMLRVEAHWKSDRIGQEFHHAKFYSVIRESQIVKNTVPQISFKNEYIKNIPVRVQIGYYNWTYLS